jgi:hypothetical protein
LFFSDLNAFVPGVRIFDNIFFSRQLLQVPAQHLFSQPYALFQAQFAGHTTLIWLPESQSLSASIIQDYAKAKQSDPHHTSAIFVAPLFNHFHSTLLDNKGIQRVKTIAKGQKRPGISAPLPYAVAVYSDNTIPQPNLSMFETTYLTQVSHGQLLPSFATVTCLAYSGVSYAFLQPIICCKA